MMLFVLTMPLSTAPALLPYHSMIAMVMFDTVAIVVVLP